MVMVVLAAMVVGAVAEVAQVVAVIVGSISGSLASNGSRRDVVV